MGVAKSDFLRCVGADQILIENAERFTWIDLFCQILKTNATIVNCSYVYQFTHCSGIAAQFSSVDCPHCLVSTTAVQCPVLSMTVQRRVQQGRYCEISATEHYDTLRFFI